MLERAKERETKLQEKLDDSESHIEFYRQEAALYE